MKCLTIKQPWAWLIFNDSGIKGFKDVENRTWATKIRGEIAIHTSKKVDLETYHNLIKYAGLKLPPIEQLETGKIIGTVEIVDCVSSYPSYWKEQDSIGFILKNPTKINQAIEIKGQLGFFNLPSEIVEIINNGKCS